MEFEKKHVQDVYSQIAGHFDQTRSYIWPKIKEFLDQIQSEPTNQPTLVAEVGCGNGKNLEYLAQKHPNLILHGSDVCEEFCQITRAKLKDNIEASKAQVIQADNLDLPYPNDHFDVVLSVAVVHHFSTHERRLQAIKELIRITKPGGKVLIQVWALEQPERSKMKFNLGSVAKSSEGNGCMDFMDTDVFVPWKRNKDHDSNSETGDNNRYYHVFSKGELEALVLEAKELDGNPVQISETFYDFGNWGVVLTKNPMDPGLSNGCKSNGLIKIYQVGGSVRDELLGIRSKDVDFAVEAPSFEVMKEHMIKNGYEIFQDIPEFFTVRAKLPKGHPFLKQTGGVNVIDFTLCRTESHYSDGRHPDKVEISDLLGDLSRRDFTVNAIAKDVDGSYIDPFHGREDLEKRVLRCVGTAHDRLYEDALRAVRAIRFTVTKGFQMDAELVDALKSDWLPPLLEKISIERIYQELYKAFAHDTLRTMKLLSEFSDEFRKSVFRDGLWLQPTNRISKTQLRKHI